MRSATGLPEPDPRLRAVVVVPARDEVQRIGACLAALAAQRGIAHDAFETIVVLDGCRDGTADAIARFAAERPSFALHAIELAEPEGVGRSRGLGMDLACARLLGIGRPHGLIASTDADSIVAPDWLARQLEIAARGALAIGGRIDLDGAESRSLSAAALSERTVRAQERMRTLLSIEPASSGVASDHHQFSGASLALTAQTYRACGGLPARAALEDEALERELRRHGIPIHRSGAVRVRTSARTDGRAPRGLARDLERADWRSRHSHLAAEFPLARLLEAKRESIALVLPAREVAETIGPIARCAARLRDAGLLDEVLVVDSASRDSSARIAERAGVDVVQESELCPELGPAQGKGDAMWRALSATDSEIVAYADTDTEDFGEHFLTGLLGPLVCEPGVQLVKGFFRRPFRLDGKLSAEGGGRVTELLARPLLNLHAPELAVFDQPLAGETAARRELLERIPFGAGYGVEIAMLIDCWRSEGLDGMAQVDLGVRQNRHQSLRDLSAMAYAVLVAASSRLLGPDFAERNASASLLLTPLNGESQMESRRVSIDERPPMADYLRAAGERSGQTLV